MYCSLFCTTFFFGSLLYAGMYLAFVLLHYRWQKIFSKHLNYYLKK